MSDQLLVEHEDGSITMSRDRSAAMLSAACEVAQIARMLADYGDAEEEVNLLRRCYATRVLKLSSVLIDAFDPMEKDEAIVEPVFLSKKRPCADAPTLMAEAVPIR